MWLVRVVIERVFFAILQEFTELGDRPPAVCCECSNQRLHRTQGRHQNCLAIRERLFAKPWLGVVSAVSDGGAPLRGRRHQGRPASAFLYSQILAGFQVFSPFNAVIDRHFRLPNLGKRIRILSSPLLRRAHPFPQPNPVQLDRTKVLTFKVQFLWLLMVCQSDQLNFQ